MSIRFVYRAYHEGVLSKRVRVLDTPSIVTWFGRHMVAARRDPRLGSGLEGKLGESEVIKSIERDLDGRAAIRTLDRRFDIGRAVTQRELLVQLLALVVFSVAVSVVFTHLPVS